MRRRAAVALHVGAMFMALSGAPASASQLSDWQSFRSAYPYHAQLIALGEPAPDGSRTIVLAEPPPWISLDHIRSQYRNVIRTPEVHTTRVGFDGWVKDVAGTLPPMSDDERQQLVEDLSRDFFHTAYKAFAVAISPPSSEHVSYDLSVTAASMRSWLGLEVPERSAAAAAAHGLAWIAALFFGVAFLRQRTGGLFVAAALSAALIYGTAASTAAATAGPLSPLHGGDAVSLPTLLASRPAAGVYVTAQRGLVILVLPRGPQLNDATIPLREFALDSDLIVGGIASRDAVAIVGRERQVPVTLMPPLRTETLLLLAAARTDELAQSYERRHMFAGGTGLGLQDWAPIYLSAELHDSEYGSLLNITDQLLKSWSEHGEIEYINFPYPKPGTYPFPTGLLEHAKTHSVTYNWNTRGVGYSEAAGDWEVMAFTRTGALPVDYLGDQDSRMRDFEDAGYAFFAGTANDPNLARVVQYASAYQIFRQFDVTAEWTPKARPHPGADALLPMGRRFLDVVRGTDLEDAFDMDSVRQESIASEAFTQLRSMQEALNRIAVDDEEPSLNGVARAMLKPREIASESMTEAQKMTFGLAQALSRNLLARQLAGRYTRAAAFVYAEAERQDPDGWIKTPSIVVSWHTGKRAGLVTGGHNLSSRISRLAVDENLSPGAVRVVEDGATRTLYYAPADRAKVQDVVRSFARNRDRSPDELGQLLSAELRAARARVSAMPEALKLQANPPALGPSREITVSVRPPWTFGGEIPASHTALLDTINMPSVLPVVIERTPPGGYLISVGGNRTIIQAGHTTAARDAVVSVMKRAGDRTVHLHFKGMDTDQAGGLASVAEIHAGAPRTSRLRTSVETADAGTKEVLASLRSQRWNAARTEVRVVDAPIGQVGRDLTLEARLPSTTGQGSLRMRISVKLRQGVQVTADFIGRLLESVRASLVQLGMDVDALLASRRVILHLRMEDETILGVKIRVAEQAGEVDVVRNDVASEAVAVD